MEGFLKSEHQEPQTPTGHPFLSELSKEELIEHLNERNHEVVDLKLELTQLREENIRLEKDFNKLSDGSEKAITHLQEENERLKAKLPTWYPD